MTFSAATCLTNIPNGVTSFNVYLGQNNYTSPNLIASSVPVSDLTVNCPYIINNIPDGTTYLSFKDSSGTFCISIPIQDNNICDNCDLGFSNYSATTISKIYCGILTGSCQTNITDYLIHWYGPDDTTTLQFTSGGGNTFPYQVPHPFSSETTSISRESGVYTPVIQNVILNGISYSNTGGTGNILFSGNCLPTTNVLPLTCSVRTNPSISFPLSAYTNYLSFNSATQGTPLPFSSTYKISTSTKYIAWRFMSKIKPDRLTLSFSGVNYTNEIGLDDIVVGTLGISSSNFNNSIFPKTAFTDSYFSKITSLTGLTVNNNDNIIINITPSENDTEWYLYITCLDDYNCNDCLLTQDYKIIGTSITGITEDCNKLNVKFNISGCSGNDINSDFLTYDVNYSQLFNNSKITSNDNTNIIPQTTGGMFFVNNICGSNSLITTTQTINFSLCQTGLTTTIYDKTFLTDGIGTGVFGFTGSSTFISTYYNSIVNAFSGLPPYTSNWSGSSNPSDLSYYRYYRLQIPRFGTPEQCGDQRKSILMPLHHTSTVFTGTTTSGGTTLYYMKITANTISNQTTYNNCDINCADQINQRVNQINLWSTGSTNDCANLTSPCYGTNQTFTNGIYYTNPVIDGIYTTISDTPASGSSIFGFFNTPDWSFNTYPFSGDPSIIIPSLSGTVCNYMSTGRNITPIYNSFYNKQYKYYYRVILTNPSDVNDFDILASPITNFNYSGTTDPLYDLAYRYSGGNITYSSSTYIIG